MNAYKKKTWMELQQEQKKLNKRKKKTNSDKR